MIPKVSISFLTNDDDPALIVDTGDILTGMTASIAIYPTPNPPLSVVTTALNKFSTAVNDAANGGTTLTAAKKAARLELTTLLRNLANYVQMTGGNSLDNLRLSGFPLQSTSRAPIGTLPAPSSLTVVLGEQTGELDAAVPPVYGASIYNWKIMVQGQTAVLQQQQTTAASVTFGSLTPGTVYTVVCNCVGAAGPSDWSDPISQMAV